MKKTEQYKLNQWELSDQIKMEDFNADNAKIEAELARLRENVTSLAYYIGQMSILDELLDQQYTDQSVILSEPFRYPSRFTCTGGVVVANNRATLTGAGATGSISTTRSPFMRSRCQEVWLWLHWTGGKVTPYFNGVKMEPAGNSLHDYSPVTGKPGAVSSRYMIRSPLTDSYTLRFDLDCMTSSSTVLYDFCLARL